LHGVTRRWHLDWELGISVLRGLGKEANEFFFIHKDVTVVFVLDYEEGISFYHLALVLESDGAVTLERLLLRNKLSRLVGADEKRGVSFIGEDCLVSESVGVAHENVTLVGSIEVKELMAVKHTEFRSVGA
jgi:hypothetical protein